MAEFVKEDRNFVNKLGQMESHTKYFSMNIVTADNPPVYPLHCDVLDTWCFSYFTPHCPKGLLRLFKKFKDQRAQYWFQ